MTIRAFAYLSLFILSILLLVGCGGKQTGSVRLSLTWSTPALFNAPANSPDLIHTRSITLAVYHKKKMLVKQILNRPSDVSTSLTAVDGVPVGTYSYLITAFAGDSGQGISLGTATGMLDIIHQGMTTLSICMQADARATLLIAPDTSRIVIGERLSYSARLLNPDGSQVIIPADSLAWTVDNPNVASINATGGVVIGSNPGVTLIRAREIGTEHTASATVTVAAKPASVFIYTDKQTINAGDLVTLHWQAVNADHVVHSVGFYANDLSGTIIVAPTTTTTYSITVSGPSGEAEGDTIVVVQTANITK